MSSYRDNARPARHADEDYARGVLEAMLVPGESFVWANRPKRGFIYEPNPNTFWNVIWTLFSLVWIACDVEEVQRLLVEAQPAVPESGP